MAADEIDQEVSPSIQGVTRALDVLELFGSAGGRSLGVTEIAQKLSLSKAVVHRILTTFRRRGFIDLEQETRRYLLGPQVAMLGLGYLDRVDAAGLARAALADLASDTNETATFSVRAGFTRICVGQVTPDRAVKVVVQLGQPLPLHAGASSKALLASMSHEEQEEFLSTYRLEPLTDLSITDPDLLRAELANARARGYAASYGEREEGDAAVAAPIFSHVDGLVGVIGVAGPVERIRAAEESIIARLLEVTQGISFRLGRRDTHEAE